MKSSVQLSAKPKAATMTSESNRRRLQRVLRQMLAASSGVKKAA